MMKKLVLIGVLIGVLVGGAVGVAAVWRVLLSPRMKTQATIRTYEADMPNPPDGSQPLEAGDEIPTKVQAMLVRNPLRGTPEEREAGRTYYEYYCVFCHGQQGRGEGPVGQSYDPAVPPFATREVRAMSDGELYRAMLTGPGHHPVLPGLVKPERRWPLVLYVRELAGRRP